MALTTEIKNTSSTTSNDQVLAQLARHDYDAFEQLYRRYVTRVYRYCYSRTDNAADAEDLTAQTFLAALEAISSYRGRGSFAAWLFSIAWRKCQDYYRQHYKQHEIGKKLETPQPDSMQEAIETRAYESGIMDCVRRQWRLLSDDRREVLLLRFWAGLNTAETAEVMARRPGAVKMLLSRAIADIRERCLDE